jgi:proteasome lid subunit RPN8/RPN11
MLVLDQELKAAISAHGKACYPFEGCGLLLGTATLETNQVQAIYPVPNAWEVVEERRIRFKISGQDWLDAEDLAVDRGLDIIGVFHSHPDHPPVASPRDLAWAAWPGFSYLITEIREGRAGASRSWLLLEDRSGFVEEEIVVQAQPQHLDANGTNEVSVL